MSSHHYHACDICGRTAKEVTKLWGIYYKPEVFPTGTITEYLEFCPECTEKINDYIEMLVKARDGISAVSKA